VGQVAVTVTLVDKEPASAPSRFFWRPSFDRDSRHLSADMGVSWLTSSCALVWVVTPPNTPEPREKLHCSLMRWIAR
jgi:hypothetical protein